MKIAKYAILIVAFIYFHQTTSAQLSGFGDSEGESSIQVGRKNTILVNAKESSIAINLSRDSFLFEDKFIWSVNLKAKSKNGIGQVLKSGEFRLEGSLELPFLFPINKSFQSFAYILPEIGFSRPKLFDANETIGEQVKPSNKFNSSISLGYNNRNLFNKFFFGISIKSGWKDNTDLIEPLSIQSVKYSSRDTSGVLQIQSVKEENAFDISEYKSGKSLFRTNIDLGDNLFNNRRILGMIHIRLKGDEGVKPLYNLGCGVYLMGKKTPSKVNMGVQLHFTDLVGNRSEKDFLERALINLVAALSFD